MVESGSVQMIKENTRSELIQGGRVSSSCIDHCYTNTPDKISEPKLQTVGTSDHLGIVIQKVSKLERREPNTIKKRCYKT